MASPRHHSIGIVTDLHPVRPGTSAALTARAIDATVHPPIVRAQEAVAAFIPRVEAPIKAVGTPILLGLFGATLVLLLVAHRARFRPAGLVFSAMLMMLLTSFHPLTRSATPRADDEPLTAAQDQRGRPDVVDIESQPPEPTTSEDDAQDPSEQPEMTMPEVEEPDMPTAPPDGMEEEPQRPVPPAFEIPPEVMARVMAPVELMRDREMMRRNSEQLRASLQALEIQLRKEARRNARRYYQSW